MKHVETIANFGYYVANDELRNKNTGDGFKIIDRRFSEINWSFRNLPQKLIREYIRQLDRPVRILDVGGGGLSQSANDIAEMFGDKVHVVNVDLLVSEAGIDENVSPVLASMFNLPFKDNSFDMVMSFQTLPHLMNASERVPKVLSEIGRVLNEGGTALLHEEYYTYPEYFDSVLPVDSFSTRITVKDRALNLNWKRRLERFTEPNRITPGKFMVMQKGFQLPRIQKVIASVPDKLRSWKTK